MGRLDPDGHGLLLDDVQEAIAELFPRPASDSDANRSAGVVAGHPAVVHAFRASDVDGDGWISQTEFGMLVEYFQYLRRNWPKFEDVFLRLQRQAVKQPQQLEATGRGEKDMRGGSELTIPAADFHETAEGLGIELSEGFAIKQYFLAAGDAEVPLAHKGQQSGQQTRASRGYSRSTAPLTFDKLCVWAVRFHTKHQPAEPKKPGPRFDGHFTIAPTAGSARREPPAIPPRQKCEAIFQQCDPYRANSLTLKQAEEALEMAFPTTQFKLPWIHRAMSAADRGARGVLTHREFSDFLDYAIFFFVHEEVLQRVRRGPSGRMNLSSFVEACRDLHIGVSGLEAEGLFEELAVTNSEHVAIHSQIAPAPLGSQSPGVTHRSDREGLEGFLKHSQRLNPNTITTHADNLNRQRPFVPFDNFCVWAARRKSQVGNVFGKVRLDPRHPRLQVPSFEQTHEFCQKHLPVGKQELDLATVSNVVDDVWPATKRGSVKELNRALLMRAYKAAAAECSGHVRTTELYLILQYIAYLDVHWTTIDGLEQEPPRRLQFAEMQRGCTMLGEWVAEEDLQAEWAALGGETSGSIAFDDFLLWLLRRHIRSEVAAGAAGDLPEQDMPRSPVTEYFTLQPDSPRSHRSGEDSRYEIQALQSGRYGRRAQAEDEDGDGIADGAILSGALENLQQFWDTAASGLVPMRTAVHELSEVCRAQIRDSVEGSEMVLRACKAADEGGDGLVGRYATP